MSFMFNPHPYDDPTAVNRPRLAPEVVGEIRFGTKESAVYLANAIAKSSRPGGSSPVLALDGYTGAQFEPLVNLVAQALSQASIQTIAIDARELLKSAAQLERETADYLVEDREIDPVLLFGRLYAKGYEGLFDADKVRALKERISAVRQTESKAVVIVFGLGCTIRALRGCYDLIGYVDVTPKEVILRAKKGLIVNAGDAVARPIKALLRRCYYVDFEAASHLRWELIKENAIDAYVIGNDPDDLKLLPRDAFRAVTAALAKCPMRCKPVYIEGVWGGHYVRKLRKLPETMQNCAWVFDLIPLEVSIVVAAGKERLEFPFFTFVQQEGEALMGTECVRKFGGYFPIRFNYDDSYHSSGNMSIQVHSGHEYNVAEFGEHGRQDESYYIVATGHGAKTYVGFNEGVDPDEFIREVKKSEREFIPVDFEKYVDHVESQPGLQVMLPAGTIHSSGRNQLILEIGSLTVGSYTYKLYDYLRADLDGIPRPIHTYHGEKVLCKERTTSWVRNNLVQEPKLVRSGSGWAEYIVGEHELLYFSLRRLEFERAIEGDTEGKFHVLTLIDGEKVCVQSVANPELSYTMDYLDVVVVPAALGRYVVRNLGNQPVCLHKTMLRDGFMYDRVSRD